MRSKRRSGITALTAAIALGIAVIPAGTLAVSLVAETPDLPTVLDSGSLPASSDATLALDTRSTGLTANTITATGIVQGSQVLKGIKSSCLLDSPETLLEFTGFVGEVSDKASYAGGSIGVAEKRTGVSCSQVGSATDEALVLTVNDSLKGTDFPLAFVAAALDLELKQGARVLATALVGESPVGYFELQSGSVLAGDSPLVDTDLPYVGPELFSPQASDSGADSGSSDNYRWELFDSRIPAFDSLKLDAIAGSFSLEGGSDGGTTAPSMFYLDEVNDGVLACGGTTVFREGTGSTPDLQVRRLSDLGDPLADGYCDEIPYTLRNSSSTGQFLKPLDQSVNAQFVMDFVWAIPVEPDVVVGGVATPVPAELPVTTVDFEADGGRGQIPLGWCPDPVVENGVLTGIADPSAVGDMEPALGNKQYACVGVRTPEIVGDEVLITEQIFLIGDVKMRLP